ncbi:MAG: hypothetical protein HZB51_07620 [Chloroflexi bacterium]|nr:hypothetical protein [Chloroflexota bacterium]
MKILADGWPKALLNCVLLSAILLYVSLPFWGFATWHRVLPEHDHVLVEADQHHAAYDPMLTSQNLPSRCVDCAFPQPSMTMMHLPNAVGWLSVVMLVLGLISPFRIAIPPARIERVAQYVLFVPSFSLSPVEHPPTG